ncbi:MAG TPA: VOC family protein [Candidatus Nitrosotalea sp.]|jgi:predicted enzyme related to lactoylglutathione lyase|nr:VOC family protein [Candidatus Nitrosotalea sp.]HEU5488023.1 VOC family protein [Candidatus Nitrosotalea sp.]HVZ62765.1 VOC family protein [Candidatus Nitrosotalea sp.]
MPRIVHFDIPSDNPERAQKFYQDVFGWEFAKWDGPMEYWMVKTGENDTPGINGGLARRMPGQIGMINTIDIPSIDEYIIKIQSNGGQILVPKMEIPGVGHYATCMDTEGNIFGIIQMNQSTK